MWSMCAREKEREKETIRVWSCLIVTGRSQPNEPCKKRKESSDKNSDSTVYHDHFKWIIGRRLRLTINRQFELGHFCMYIAPCTCHTHTSSNPKHAIRHHTNHLMTIEQKLMLSYEQWTIDYLPGREGILSRRKRIRVVTGSAWPSLAFSANCSICSLRCRKAASILRRISSSSCFRRLLRQHRLPILSNRFARIKEDETWKQNFDQKIRKKRKQKKKMCCNNSSNNDWNHVADNVWYVQMPGESQTDWVDVFKWWLISRRQLDKRQSANKNIAFHARERKCEADQSRRERKKNVNEKFEYVIKMIKLQW